MLLIEPDDDKTFSDDLKDALINIMTEPMVIRNIKGGHLAIIFNPEDTLMLVDEFINSQNL